jgi:threonine/homoserine/homoserine lactone efflux protein
MPEPHTLLIFAGASLALYLAPGPDMLLIANRAIAGGARAGAAAALGVFAGLIVHMLAAAFGLATLLTVWPVAFTVMKWAGAAYLVYLGLMMLLTRDRGGLSILPTARGTAWRLFRQGLLVNLMNPKIALFFMAFLPQFVDPNLMGPLASPAAQILFFGALFNAGSLIWVLTQAALFARLGAWLFDRPSVRRWIERLSGTVLLALAARLATSER